MNHIPHRPETYFMTNPNHLIQLYEARKPLMEAAQYLVTDFNLFGDEQKCMIKELRKDGVSVPDFSHKLLVKRTNNTKNMDILIWEVNGVIHRSSSVSLVKKHGSFALQENLLELAIWKKGCLQSWKSKIIKVEIAAAYLRYLWQKNEEMIQLLEKSLHLKYLQIATFTPQQTDEEFQAELDAEYRLVKSLGKKRQERNRRSREKRKLKSVADKKIQGLLTSFRIPPN